jgi:hypothetical protein
MDDQMTSLAYETPQVVDYGDLQELTAGCAGGTGGDAHYPNGYHGYPTGPSNPAAGCKSL